VCLYFVCTLSVGTNSLEVKMPLTLQEFVDLNEWSVFVLCRHVECEHRLFRSKDALTLLVVFGWFWALALFLEVKMSLTLLLLGKILLHTACGVYILANVDINVYIYIYPHFRWCSGVIAICYLLFMCTPLGKILEKDSKRIIYIIWFKYLCEMHFKKSFLYLLYGKIFK
jgi:hypothetical protein